MYFPSEAYMQGYVRVVPAMTQSGHQKQSTLFFYKTTEPLRALSLVDRCA